MSKFDRQSTLGSICAPLRKFAAFWRLRHRIGYGFIRVWLLFSTFPCCHVRCHDFNITLISSNHTKIPPTVLTHKVALCNQSSQSAQQHDLRAIQLLSSFCSPCWEAANGALLCFDTKFDRPRFDTRFDRPRLPNLPKATKPNDDNPSVSLKTRHDLYCFDAPATMTLPQRLIKQGGKVLLKCLSSVDICSTVQYLHDPSWSYILSKFSTNKSIKIPVDPSGGICSAGRFPTFSYSKISFCHCSQTPPWQFSPLTPWGPQLPAIYAGMKWIIKKKGNSSKT